MKRVLVLCLATLSMAFPSSRSTAQAVLVPSIPTIMTVAGNGTACSSLGAICGDGGSATAANLGGPFGVAVDNAGNIYIADKDGNRIRKVDTTGKITTIAGNGVPCLSPTASCGDTGPGISANLNAPRAVAVDGLGNVYIADSGDNRVRKLLAGTNLITTVAGTGTVCPSTLYDCGDGRLATSAALTVGGLAVDTQGNIYVGDITLGEVRKVTVATGVIEQFAGNGTKCSSQTAACGDGGSSFSANLYSPYGLAVDAAGNLYIADSGINRVRKVATNHIITTVAGNGTFCASSTATCGDGGAAKSANLYDPMGVTVDSAGNLYIADSLINRVRKVDAGTGVITTLAANGTACSTSGCGDGGPASSASIGDPIGLALDTGGNLYVADYADYRIRKVTAASTTATGLVTFPSTAVGSSAVTQNLLIQLAATATISSISAPVSQGGHQEYSIGTITGCTLGASNPGGTICTVPITFTPAYPGQRWVPLQVVTSAGNINFGLQGIGIGPQAAFTPAIITTVAGNGMPGNPGAGGTIGDGGPALQAQLDYPWGVAVDAAGNIYVSNVYYDNGVHRVDAVTGIMTRVAGVGDQGYSGDNGPATSAAMFYPEGLALDSQGNLYIADGENSRIRKVTATTGIITTVAGNGTSGYLGDNGPATSAEIVGSQSIALDALSNLYLADSGRIRKVTAATGIITTVAGNGTAGWTGDNGPATSAEINPQGIAVDAAGNIYIADINNNVVRKVTASTGVITTVAGMGQQGESGDGGLATSAALYQAQAVAVDAAGNLYILEDAGNRVRKVSAATGIITTIAGTNTVLSSGAYPGDGGPATSAAFSLPASLALDAAGNIYIADLYNQRVRKITVATSAVNFGATAVGTTSADSPQTVTLSNIGNAGLIAPAPGSGTNASLSANFGFGNSTTCPAGSSGGTLSAGADCLYAINFTPTAPGTISGSLILTDNVFTSPQQTISLNSTSTPAKITPALTVSPSSSSITVVQPLTVTIAASGGSGNPAVTGSVILTSGTYTSAATTLSSGSATINIPAGSLPLGSDTLTASYTPDGTSSATYNSANGSNVVTVTAIVPTITFTVANHTFGDAPFTVSATSNSAGAITYSVVSGPATINGSTVTLTGAGSVTLQASQAASGNYAASTQTASFTVAPVAPTIGFSVANRAYGDAPFIVAATSNSSGALTYSVVSGPATINGSTVTLTGVGPVTLQVSQAAAGNYAAANQTASFTVAAAIPTITFTVADHTYGDAAFTVAATSASSGLFTYTVISGPATINGSTVTLTGIGPVTLQASQASSPNYTAAIRTATFNVAAAAPSITFTVADHTYGDAAFTVAATSNSTGALTYSVVSGPASVNGSTISLTGIGAITLQVSQAAATNYAAATKTATFNVAAATPAITFAVSDHVYGDAAFSVAATSNSTGALTYSVVSGPASVNGSTVTLTGAGPVTLQASQAASSNYTAATKTATFNIAAAAPAITFTVADHTYGDAAFTVAATSNSTGALTYSVVSGPATINGSTVTLTGVGAVTLQASQASSANYLAATKTTTFNVAVATPAITFTVADHTYGDAAFTVAATSNSTGALTYTVVSGPATINGSTVTLTGAGPVTLQVSQAAVTNYTAATKTTTFNVAAAAPSIAFTVPDHIYGDAPFTVAATSNSTGALTYSVVSGPATINGSTVTLTGIGAVTLQASQAAATNYAAATKTATFNVTAAAQTITFTAPASPVTYGTSAIALSATASSGLTIRFSVLSGPGTLSGSSLTITGAGTVVVAADQAGNANYAAATEVTRSIVVNKAAPASVTLTASPNPALVLNAVTLTATVSSPISTPSGSVAFFDGATMLSTVTLSSGAASFTTSALATGTHSITAQYLGDSNFTTLTSSATTEVMQDFALTPGSGSTTQTVSAGGTATYTFPVTLSSGTTLPAPVTFTATGLPAGATAAFNPASLPAGSGATTVTLTITLPKTARLETIGHPGESLPVVVLAVLLLPFSRRKLRAGRLLKSAGGSLALFTVFGIATLLAGCGSSGGSGGGGGGGGAQPGTYNVTVTATSGTLSHTSTVVLIVQ